MRKLVVLKLDGDLEQGVRVTLEIGEEGERPNTEVTGQLPRATDLVTAIDQWQSAYRSFGQSARIKAKKIVYGGSIVQWREDCYKSAADLRSRLNDWLLSESFRPLRERWLQQLSRCDEVRVLIRTSSVSLRKLPWHLWDLVENYPKAEVAYCAPESEQSAWAKTPTYRDKVRILAILGNSTGINVLKDRQLLENLPDAATTFLVEPQRQDINDQLWNQAWDILFFAGHSKTEGNTGRIYINQTDSLTIAELRYGLRNAVANGLQLAIFNSCDGLGLALELEQLHIGQMIVMREPVPDQVAQVFLTYFLAAFAKDKSFYLAEREARLKLHGLEDNFACASWLPAIFQNPAAVPPMWQDLGRRPTDVCPYRGLFAFREEDAPFFYGRDAFTQMLVEAVQKQSLVAVIGPSGSGKSSVVFAGLIPQLRSERTWLIEAFRPGDRPFRNLAAKLVPLLETQMSETDQLLEINKLATALRQGDLTLRDAIARILEKNSGDRLLLVADQFEELYTLCRDARERLLFLDNLLEASEHTPNFTLVLTLRADFLGQALSYRPFGDALQYADLKLSPMNREELQAAVEQPAAMLGVTIESGLTERILEAVSTQPGDLPLLEFALNQLWAKQRDAQLTHAAYEEIGGVEAALSRYAEEAYGRLNEEEKERARRIFIQLVRPGEGTEDTRRLATRTEVGEENWDLVTRLASARLMVSSRDEEAGEETVEIVHEALIGGWFRLRLWIELDRSFRTWQERLRASLRQWEASGRDEGALLRGAPLAEAEGWLLSRPVELNPAERSFIEQSRLVRSRQRQRLVFGLSLGLVGALSLAGMAGLQWQRAEYQRQSTLARELAFQAESLGNQQDKLLPRSVLLAMEAMQRSPSPMAEQVLRQSVTLLPRPVAKLTESSFTHTMKHEDAVTTIVFSPNGNYLATADKIARVWEVTSGREVERLRYRDTVVFIAFSRDGKYLATVGLDDTAQVREITSGREIIHLITEKAATRSTLFGRSDSNDFDALNTIAFSLGGKYLARAGLDKTVRVWEVTSGREVVRLTNIFKLDRPNYLPAEFNPIAITFSPDGRYLATITNGFWKSKEASSDLKEASSIRVWEVNSGREVARMNYDSSHVKTITFSPDGRYLATATSLNIYDNLESTVSLWETTSGRKIAHMERIEAAAYMLGFPNNVNAIAFSPDGRYLAGTGSYGAWVWEATSGRGVAYISQEDSVNTIAFSPDGKYLATASKDKTARVWQISSSSGREVTHLRGFYGKDGAVAVWLTRGVRELVEVARIPHEDNVVAVAFSPNGKYLATASQDKTARVQPWRREDLIAETCARLRANLTRYEWTQYLPGEPYHKTCPNLPVPDRPVSEP